MDSENERFRSIYLKCMPLLRVIAKRRGIPYDEIDDIVQDTFFSFYRHYAEFLPTMTDDEVKKILTVILRNRCIDYLRRRSTHPVDYLDPSVIREQRFDPVRDDVLRILMEDREYSDVMKALKEMRSDWAEIFILLAIEDRSVEEVSKRLGISKQACRTRLSRARKCLRKKLGHYQPASVEKGAKGTCEQTCEKTSGNTGIPDRQEIPEISAKESSLKERRSVFCVGCDQIDDGAYGIG